MRGLEALDRVLGVRPIGYRAPSWDMNYRTPGLLARHGFRYDSGLMDSDHPYRLGTSPEPGAPSLVELPVPLESLDDWNRWNYVPGYAASPILPPSVAVDGWAEELDAIVAVGGLFSLTMHPFVSGRPGARRGDRGPHRAGRRRWTACGSRPADEIAAWVEALDLPPVVHEPPVVGR